MDDLNLNSELHIDPTMLDVECLRQPELFMKWAEMEVEAHSDVERAKLRMDVIKSQIDKNVREDPAKYGLSKITEAAVTSAVLSSEEYRAAYTNFISAKENASLLDHAVRAFEQRKAMINNLIILHGQQYFAGPSVPHDLAASYQEYKEKKERNLTEAQGEKIRIRKKK